MAAIIMPVYYQVQKECITYNNKEYCEYGDIELASSGWMIIVFLITTIWIYWCIKLYAELSNSLWSYALFLSPILSIAILLIMSGVN